MITPLLLIYLFIFVAIATVKSQEQTTVAVATPTPPPPLSKPEKEISLSSQETANDITFRFDYQPPLSITDALRLISRLIGMLNPADEQFKELRREKALEVIEVVSDYVKLADDRHSSLPYYRWYRIGEKRVSLGGIDEDRFDVFPLLRHVSAISFVALRDDVFVHTIRVIDDKGKETDFTVERWIRVGFPRKEVCFMYFPTNLSKIIITYSAREGATIPPKLMLYGGRVSVPEYGKAALYYLTRAQRSLVNNSELSSVIKDLRSASDSLLRFKASRQI